MIKLTFYPDDKAYGPPRWVKHISPRIPQNESHKLHVVLYTDDQLKKAGLGELYVEGQELETSIFFWMRATSDFKEKFREYYSFKPWMTGAN